MIVTFLLGCRDISATMTNNSLIRPPHQRAVVPDQGSISYCAGARERTNSIEIGDPRRIKSYENWGRIYRTAPPSRAASCRQGENNYLPSLAIRWVSRDTFRLADFLWMMPVRAARMSAGSAATRAACAATLLPLVIASSTLRSELRMRERRALLTSVRRAILRVAFLADLVLAIDPSVDWVLTTNKATLPPAQKTTAARSPPDWHRL